MHKNSAGNPRTKRSGALRLANNNRGTRGNNNNS